jgi:hypothetical protein
MYLDPNIKPLYIVGAKGRSSNAEMNAVPTTGITQKLISLPVAATKNSLTISVLAVDGVKATVATMVVSIDILKP